MNMAIEGYIEMDEKNTVMKESMKMSRLYFRYMVI